MKKLVLFISLLFIIFVPKVYAISVDESYNYCTRDESNNYGVKKHWKINEYNQYNAIYTPCVDASLKIYDYANILTDAEEYTLKLKIDEYVKKYKSEIVIITIDSSFSFDLEVENFAADFYDYNDFGLDFEKYSGTVIVRNIDREDRYYNIYTFGDAQLYFSGQRTEKILDSIYDDLYHGNYLQGFGTYINMLSNYHEKGIPMENRFDRLDENGVYIEGFNPPIFICSVISIIITSIIISVQVGAHKMVRKSLNANDYLDLSSVKYTVRNNIFSHSITTSRTISDSSSGGSSGGGHSSGSSGGGHSSGGGRRG